MGEGKKVNQKKILPKKKKISKIVYVWIALIILIIVIVQKKKSLNLNTSKENNNNLKSAQSTESVKEYVEKTYLHYDLLMDAMGGLSQDEKIKYVIDVLNQENGSVPNEIDTNVVKEKYKEIFKEDLEITEGYFLLANGYEYRASENVFKLNETSGLSPNYQTSKDEMRNHLEITDVKSGKAVGEYILTIRSTSRKTVFEIWRYALDNPSAGLDKEKLEEIKTKEENGSLESSDIEYLNSLINDTNREELMRQDYTGNLTVKDVGNGKFDIVDYEIK